MWKGFSVPFSSVIPSWKAFPHVERFSRLVEREEGKKGRERGKKREEADASSLSELANPSPVSPPSAHSGNLLEYEVPLCQRQANPGCLSRNLSAPGLP